MDKLPIRWQGRMKIRQQHNINNEELLCVILFMFLPK